LGVEGSREIVVCARLVVKELVPLYSDMPIEISHMIPLLIPVFNASVTTKAVRTTTKVKVETGCMRKYGNLYSTKT